VSQPTRWVLLAYRLPREPSTPRIALWRQLRRLGVAQVSDGVVALPLDARTREQLEWVADSVIEHRGEATVWLAEPGSAAQGRALARQMTEAIEAEYAELIARAGATTAGPKAMRGRTLAALRRELGRIAARDFFPSASRDRARAAVERVAVDLEAAS
jgi:hypothetical protein